MARRISPQVLKGLKINMDTTLVLERAATETLLFSRTEVLPGVLFMACFLEKDNFADPAAKDIITCILKSFSMGSNFAQVTRSLGGAASKQLNEEEFRFFVLLNAVGNTIGSRVNLTDRDRIRQTLSPIEQVGLSSEIAKIIESSATISKMEHGRDSVLQPLDILRVMLSDPIMPADVGKIVTLMGTTPKDITFIIHDGLQKAKNRNLPATAFAAVGPNDEVRPKSKMKKIKDFGSDLSEKARNGELDQLIGREKEIAQVIEIISQCDMPNCIIVGEPGVGKTAIVDGLVQRIVSGQAGEQLKEKQVFGLDTNSMVAGSSLRGSFEEKLEDFLKATAEDKNLITVINEIHTVVGAGRAAGVSGAADPIKRALDEKRLSQVIGTTTEAEYRKFIEPDRALAERFIVVKIAEPDANETREILQGKKVKYEQFHQVTVMDECIDAIVTAVRNYSSGHSPRREILLLDRICTSAKIEGVIEVTADMALAKIAEVSGIPARQLSADNFSRISLMQEALQERIIGQPEAITAVSSGLRRNAVGLRDKKKPIYSALFAGSSGVGKTEVTRLLAEYYFPDKNDLIRFDMSEYMEKHSVSRLIGSPPGYIGSDEGGQLVNKVRAKPYCVLVFDEIEKAHPDVMNILLQLLEEGMVTDSKGNIAYFNHAIVILTSNVGSSNLSAKPIGFGSSDAAALRASRQDYYDKEIHHAFPAALRGRLDDIIIFNQLSFEDYVEIAKIQIGELTERLYEGIGIIAYAEDQAVYESIAASSISDEYGAREMKSYIKRHIETPLSEYILCSGLGRDDMIKISVDADFPDTYLLEVASPEQIGV